MKRKINLSFAILAVALVCVMITSCSKKKGCTNAVALNYDADAEEDNGTCQLAGTGGATTIVAFPKHHGGVIWHSTAYVKFNVVDFPGEPGTAAYDLTVPCEPNHDHVELAGLKVGKYYIYMTGYDSTIAQTVKGGIPYILTQATGEKDIEVPVTED